MVYWLEKKGNELFTPLLPHGSDHYPTAATTTTTATATTDTQAAAAAHAVSRATTRQDSTTSAAKRRRIRLQRIQSNLRSVNRRVSNVSAANSEITHQIENLSSYDSDASDYERQEEDDDDDDDDGDVPNDEMTPGMMAKSAAVVLVTIAGIASYLASFVATITLTASAAATTMLGVAGAVCILTVPLVWLSEWRLAHLPALRRRVNDLRHEAQRFQRQVDMLLLEEEDLREEVESLKDSKDRLELLVKEKNSGNVDELVALVHDNQLVLRKMKENLRQLVLQDVVKLVLQSDFDRDNIISKKEANILETRLFISLQIYGVLFDAVKFHRAVGLSPSLCGVMTIVKRLLPDENNRLSSFYSVDSDDDDDESEVDEEEDDVYDMYYVPVEEPINRGCTDSIRLCKEYLVRKGEKPKLMSISTALRNSVKGLRSSVMSCDE